jgi:hypothetical protein
MSAKLSEELAILSTIDPAVQSAATHATDVIDLAQFPRTLWLLLTGAYAAAGATANLQIYANTANSASGGTAIVGKTFTAATFSGSAAGTNAQGAISLLASEAEAALAGARYAYGVLTVATDTVAAAVAVLGGTARYAPVDGYDLASVKEIIA